MRRRVTHHRVLPWVESRSPPSRQHRPTVKRVTVTPRTVTPPSVTRRSVTLRLSAVRPPPAHRAACYGGMVGQPGCTSGCVGRCIPGVYITHHVGHTFVRHSFSFLPVLRGLGGYSPRVRPPFCSLLNTRFTVGHPFHHRFYHQFYTFWEIYVRQGALCRGSGRE